MLFSTVAAWVMVGTVVRERGLRAVTFADDVVVVGIEGEWFGTAFGTLTGAADEIEGSDCGLPVDSFGMRATDVR